jgi:hypothetical protein
MKKSFTLCRIFKVCAIILLGLSCNQAVAQPYLCRGQVTYTYPDGKHTYAQYDLYTRQRNISDCLENFCPAKCPFETAARPKKNKVINSQETGKVGTKKETSSKQL